MDCTAVSQKLPWYLNETLAPEEKAALGEHLTSCSECQRELEETQHAFELFGAHPSSDSLIGLARSGIASREERVLLEDHLASCPSCSEELSLIRQSFEVLDREGIPQKANRLRWRLGAGLAAAALLILAMGLGWRQTWLRLRALQNPAWTDPRGLTLPQADFMALNLFPEEMNQRSGSAKQVDLSHGEKGLALTLHSQLQPDSGPYRLELWDSFEAKLWEAPVTRQEDGTFTLILPEPFLKTQGIAFRLFSGAADAPPERFALRFSPKE